MIIDWAQKEFPNCTFEATPISPNFDVLAINKGHGLYVYEDRATTGTSSEKPLNNQIYAYDPEFFNKIRQALIRYIMWIEHCYPDDIQSPTTF
jgi:hypothetical protein